MSNALAKFMGGGDLPDLTGAEAQKALAADAGDSSGGGDFDYLSFSGKSGKFALGRGKDVIDDDLFVIDPRMIMRGWACWKDAKVVARVGWSIYRPDQAVAKVDLEDHGPYDDDDGWAPERSFVMLRLKDGKQVVFSTTSKSGNNAFADVNGKILEQSVQEKPTFPLVWFDEEEFTAQGKKNFKPRFNIDKWLEQASVEAWAGGDLTSSQLEEGKAAKKKRKRKAA